MNEGVDDKWMEHLDAESRLQHGAHAVGSRVKEMGRGAKGGGKCGREGCGACIAVLTLLLLWRCRAREGRFGPLQPPQCVFHRHHRSLL
jgi:hypothetical protein